MNCIDPNDFSGSDSEKINMAINAAAKSNSIVKIPARKPDQESARDFWLLDSAILLPENMTLIISNTRLKLSDSSRDNFIRSANCQRGVNEVKVIENIHIIGEGRAILEGADHPRASGDGGKTLGIQKITPYPVDGADLSKRMTYGTDAGKEGETQTGDWRNIGVLLAKVHNFSIENLVIRQAHCWAVSLEYCCNGLVRNLEFASNENKIIDGVAERTLNQDGLNLRRGCRDITVEDIHGYSGDDLIALTAIGVEERAPGLLGKTEFCGGNDDRRKDDVYNIVIRNVHGYSDGGYFIIRFLNQRGVRMHHITVDGVLETAPADHIGWATIKIGAPNYAGSAEKGETYAFRISNITSQTRRGITFGAPLSDSMISNFLYFKLREDHSILSHHGEKEYPLENVFFYNLETVDKVEK